MQGDDGNWRAELEKRAFSPRGGGRTESASLMHLYTSNVRSIQLQTKSWSISDSLGAASNGARDSQAAESLRSLESARTQSSPLRMESARTERIFTPRKMSAHQLNRNTVLFSCILVFFFADPFSMELMRESWQGDVVVKPISAGPRLVLLTDSRLQERGSEWEKTTAPADAEASAALTNPVRTASPRKGSRPSDLRSTPRCVSVSNVQLSLLLLM